MHWTPTLAQVTAVCVSGALALAAFLCARQGLANYDDLRLTATALVTLAGTLTGFLLTALSLLIGAADRPFLSNLRLTGHFGALVRLALSTAAIWMTVALFGLAAHIAPRDWQLVLLPLGMSSAAVAAVMFVVLGRQFVMIVSRLSR